MSDETCATCRFFVAELSTMEGDGSCRRHAPIAPSVLSEVGYMQSARRWPAVFSNDWCGDYEPVPEATEAGA
jgi:hypothetical protein